MTRTRRSALVGAILLTAVLAACSPADGEPAPDTTTATATATTAETGESADVAPATAGSVAGIDPADVVAEQTYTVRPAVTDDPQDPSTRAANRRVEIVHAG